MANFEFLKQEHETWLSPSFYTHTGGYYAVTAMSINGLQKFIIGHRNCDDTMVSDGFECNNCTCKLN